MFQITKELIGDKTHDTRLHDLAQAIRRGCVLRPVQAFGRLFRGTDSACVWGAVVEADYPLARVIKAENMGIFHCPISSFMHKPLSLDQMMIHLNDVHSKSREWIADWVESQQQDSGHRDA